MKTPIQCASWLYRTKPIKMYITNPSVIHREAQLKLPYAGDINFRVFSLRIVYEDYASKPSLSSS